MLPIEYGKVEVPSAVRWGHPGREHVMLEVDENRRVTMAQQHLVRVLVPVDDASRLRDELLRSEALDVREVDIEEPDVGVYRDERSDRQLLGMARHGRSRMLVGGAVGALVGLLLVLVIPVLRELMPWSMILFVPGGASLGALTYVQRGVQVDKESDDMPDRLYRIDAEDRSRERALRIVVGRDRNPVEDLLESRGYILLDSEDPKLDGEAER